MPTLVDEAVVLRHWEFSETSQTVSLLCRASGALRGLAKGARRERSAFSGGFETLTRGEIVAIVKPSTELAVLTEWDLREVFWGARRDLAAHRAQLYMVDLVHHAVTLADPHPALYDALVAALREAVDAPSAARALLRFQWTLLVETGYRPRLATDEGALPATVGFSPRAGGVVPDPGPGVDAARDEVFRVRRATIRLLERVERGEPLADADPRAVDRASRLPAASLRTILGRELPSLDAVLPA